MSFKKGVSGNPAGRPRKDASDAADYVRKTVDSWYSPKLGYGTSRDKRRSYNHGLELITQEAALDLWRGDDLAKKIIEYYPLDALSSGFSVEVFADSEASDEENKKIEAKEQEIRDHLKRINLVSNLIEATSRMRAMGGAALLIGAIDNSEDWSKPLGNVRELEWLTPLSPRELQPAYYYTDLRSGKRNQPSHYYLNPQTHGTSKDTPTENVNILIHESRLLIFSKLIGGEQFGSAGFGWGDSVLVPCYEVLRDFNLSWSSVGSLMTDLNQGVYSVAKLPELIAADGGAAIDRRMQLIENSRSSLRAIVIDKEAEGFERSATPLSGVSDVIDRLMLRLASAAEIPVTRLFRQSPAGQNATGESDLRNYYDDVEKWRRFQVEPQIEKIVGMVARLYGVSKFEIKFPTMWKPDDQEQATSRKLQAETDQIYIANNVVSAEEIAASRFGGRQYSYETKIDFELRKKLQAPVEPAVDLHNEPDPNDPNDPNSSMTKEAP